MADGASYTFLTRLGKGGFGEVYLATQSHPGGLKRHVAVKLLKADVTDHSEAVKRLLDEGHMLSMLRHPSIVGVHELTRVDGRLALITEYVDGIDVSKQATPGNLLPERVVWEIVAEVASALDCAWNTRSGDTGKPLQLIHRDIKPENIRIGRHGEVKLLDFGIARSTEVARQAETAAGQLPFTPGYVPPEIFLRGEVNSTTDIYALGCTMYRLLSGRKLYGGMDLAQTVQLAVIREEYERWLEQSLSDDRFARARQVLAWMLHYEPEGRPSAAQTAQACEDIAEDVPGPSRRQWARRQQFPTPEMGQGALTGRTVQEPTLTIASPRSDPDPLLHLRDEPTLRDPRFDATPLLNGDRDFGEFDDLGPAQRGGPVPTHLDDEDEDVDDDATAADDSLQRGLHGNLPLFEEDILDPPSHADAPTVIDRRSAFIDLEDTPGPQPEREADPVAAKRTPPPLPEPSPMRQPTPPPPAPGRPMPVWLIATAVVFVGLILAVGLYAISLS